MTPIKAGVPELAHKMATVSSSASTITASEQSKPTPLPHTPKQTDAASLHEKDIIDKEDGGVSADALQRELSRIDTADFPSAFPLAMITIALLLSIFLCALDMTIVATAIPRITDQFKSLDQVGWYGSAFFLTLGGKQSPVRKL